MQFSIEAGAWIGTAFLVCPESLTPEAAHPRILRAKETDTVYTRAIDVAMGYPWPSKFGERVLRSDFIERWTGEEEDLAHNDEARQGLSRAKKDDDFTLAEIDAGQGVRVLKSARPASEIVRDFSAGAVGLLSRWAETTQN